MLAVVIILLVIVILVIALASSYNSLVRTRNRAEEALAALDAHLRRRHDLVPKLVDTVKGYTEHEESTLSAVISARAGAIDGGARERGADEDGLTAALNKLFALAESYPDLKADKGFLQLQGELSSLEEDILNARKYYNALARTMNDKVESFPSNLVASLFHFSRLDYLSTPEEAKEDVRVVF